MSHEYKLWIYNFEELDPEIQKDIKKRARDEINFFANSEITQAVLTRLVEENTTIREFASKKNFAIHVEIDDTSTSVSFWMSDITVSQFLPNTRSSAKIYFHRTPKGTKFDCRAKPELQRVVESNLHELFVSIENLAKKVLREKYLSVHELVTKRQYLKDGTTFYGLEEVYKGLFIKPSGPRECYRSET